MPIPGLSLVGFLGQQEAIEHFRKACTRTDADSVLVADWQAARARLGDAISGAGHPKVEPIPESHAAYVQQLTQAPWLQRDLQGGLRGCRFQMVEIEKVLAYQTNLSEDQASRYGQSVASPPTLDQLLQICLPLDPAPPAYTVTPGPNSLLITGRDTNLTPVGTGHILFKVGTQEARVGGIVIGTRFPLVHVVVYQGMYYLHNGLHRAYGLGRAGATKIPCVVRQVTKVEDVGFNPPVTFDEALLRSSNPPTLGHYIRGRAFDVPLRQFARALHVSWAEHFYPAE